MIFGFRIKNCIRPISFFLRPLVFARYPFSWKLAILQNGVKKFDFPETQGKYPLWYIKLFVYYHWSQITHKKENYGPFVSSGVEKGLENSKVEKFLRFFLFRSTISIEPFVRFWWSFLQTADNLIFFLDKKRKSFKKTSKVRKKSKKLRIDEFLFFGRKLQFQIFCEILKFFKTFLF